MNRNNSNVQPNINYKEKLIEEKNKVRKALGLLPIGGIKNAKISDKRCKTLKETEKCNI